jgi:hypothetical protein
VEYSRLELRAPTTGPRGGGDSGSCYTYLLRCLRAILLSLVVGRISNLAVPSAYDPLVRSYQDKKARKTWHKRPTSHRTMINRTADRIWRCIEIFLRPSVASRRGCLTVPLACQASYLVPAPGGPWISSTLTTEARKKIFVTSLFITGPHLRSSAGTSQSSGSSCRCPLHLSLLLSFVRRFSSMFHSCI